ncbi:hypothetical protein J3A83DRAFT_1687619 [Scleroderma citrinum]
MLYSSGRRALEKLVINLIAGYEKAPISSGVEGCTLDSTEHRLIADTFCLRIFDTVGLNCTAVEEIEYLNAIQNAHKLIKALNHAGGVDLLLFCFPARRITDSQRASYKLFQEYLCEKKVPVVMIVTHLEEEEVMEQWWKKYEVALNRKFECLKDHACITAIGSNAPAYKRNPNYYRTKVEESRKTILELLRMYVHEPRTPFVVDTDKWLLTFLKKMAGLIIGGLPKKEAIRTMLVQECGYGKEQANAIIKDMFPQGLMGKLFGP